MSQKKTKKNDRAANYAALSALGIAQVEITYDGCGDSGCIEEIVIYDAAGKRIETLPETPVSVRLRDTVWQDGAYQTRFAERQLPVREAIEQLGYNLLEEHFAGWELDEGSRGTITLDVRKRRGSIAHEASYTATTSHNVRFT